MPELGTLKGILGYHGREGPFGTMGEILAQVVAWGLGR